MILKSKKILGIDITLSQKDDILEEIWKYLAKIRNPKSEIRKEIVKPLIIYTPNPEIITYAQKDETFARIVNSAQINLPDGAGVVWALENLYGIKVQKLSGIDFMQELVKLVEKESPRIGLIGGRVGVALQTRECLLVNHPNLKVEVFDVPEVKVSGIRYQVSRINENKIRNTRYLILNTRDNDEQTIKYFQNLVKKIIEQKIDILFVALGFPKQEYFIDRIKYYVLRIKYDKPLILMAVGGAFDYISGGVSRAPKWMRNMGLEWLFRLIREPWRLLRMVKGGEFFLRVAFSSFFPIKYP